MELIKAWSTGLEREDVPQPLPNIMDDGLLSMYSIVYTGKGMIYMDD